MSLNSTVCKGCRNKACHNKIESHWRDKDGQINTVEDCAPRRTLLLMQETINRQVAQQAAFEEVRNDLEQVKNALQELIEQVAQPNLVEEVYAEMLPRKVDPPRDDLRSLPHRGV